MEHMARNESSDLKKFLRSVLPEWRVSQLMMAEKKLRNIGIETAPELLRVLGQVGNDNLNEQLRRHGEREFSTEALAAMRSQTTLTSESTVHATPSNTHGQNYLIEEQHEKASTDVVETIQKGRGPSLKDRFLAAKSQTTSPVAVGNVKSLFGVEDYADPVALTASMKKARSQLEEEIEIATGQLEEAETKGDHSVWLARKADVDHLNLRLDALAKNVVPDGRRCSTSGSCDTSHWFEVVFNKVFVKRYPSEKATTWGWVLRGQTVEVLPKWTVDEIGREWIELTLFELWRSCMCDPPLKYEDNRSARGFCLVDASSEGLGVLMRGPIARNEWPALDAGQVAHFHHWCGITKRHHGDFAAYDKMGNTPAYKEQHPSQKKESLKGVHFFTVAHAGLQVYERASTSSKILGEKNRGASIECNLDLAFAGWSKLAGERGWVVEWMLKPKNDELGKYCQSSRGSITRHYSIAKTADLGQGLITDVREALKLQVAAVVDDADLDSDFAGPSSGTGPHLIYKLEAAIERAKACHVEEGIVEVAERHLDALSKEGEPNRRRRLLRSRLAKACSAQDAKEVARRASYFGFMDVSEEALAMSAQFEDDQSTTRSDHARLLQQLSSAVALGDKLGIKAARDAASAAGVPKRELARIFALAQS